MENTLRSILLRDKMDFHAEEKRGKMKNVFASIALILLAVVLIVAGPVIVALALGTLFALPFWPSFWLAVGVVLSVGGSRIHTSK